MSVVLDASAVLAMVLHEPGRDAVRAAMGEAAISTVNLSEVYTKVVEKRLDVGAVRDALLASRIQIVAFDDEAALLAGKLREQTKAFGLSLGDRACLATALIEKGAVMTADKAWRNLDLGVEIIVIR